MRMERSFLLLCNRWAERAAVYPGSVPRLRSRAVSWTCMARPPTDAARTGCRSIGFHHGGGRRTARAFRPPRCTIYSPPASCRMRRW